MKRSFFVFLIIAVLSACMVSCNALDNFGENVISSLESDAESVPKIEEMMNALAENRVSDAKDLMHPQVKENSDSAISQMVVYLDGRKVSSMELNEINVNVSSGTSGKTRTEDLCYVATLDDGEIICIAVSYRSHNEEKGFLSFQLLLGVYTNILNSK